MTKDMESMNKEIKSLNDNYKVNLKLQIRKNLKVEFDNINNKIDKKFEECLYFNKK